MSPSRGRPWPLVLVLALGGTTAGAMAARRWLDAVEVAGGSMLPTLSPGDRLLVERWTFARRPPRVGEVVLAPDPRDPDRELVKRVVAVDGAAERLEVAGDAAEVSTDSRTFGALPIADVRWRALVRYWPAGRIGPIR